MNKETTINTRIDIELKSKAGAILSQLGLNHSTAINLYYKQIVMQQGLPFRIHIPNAETLKSMELSARGEGLTEYNTVEELMEDSKSW